MKFQGGESAVQRLMQAYGFTMKKQLGDHLGAGTGTISTWVKRDYFPGEAIVRCALETGASLEWLASGVGEINRTSSLTRDGHYNERLKLIKHKSLHRGELTNLDDVYFDSNIIEIINENVFLLSCIDKHYFIENYAFKSSEGKWLLQKADIFSISEIEVAPDEKYLIDGVLWPKKEISLIGVVIAEISKKY